jgi:engulfment/cell motility protein 1
VPTNNVTTKDGVTVRARIDPTLTVDDVVKQLCINLKIKDPPVMFALRDETDDLVTNDNLRKKIKTKVNLKYVYTSFALYIALTHVRLVRLVNAPTLEAAEIVEKLSVRDDKTLKFTLFSLQKFIRVRRVLAMIVFHQLTLVTSRRSNLRRSSLIEMALGS